MNPELKLLGISQKTYDFVKSCENSLGNIYEGIEANEAYTQARVLKAFQDNCIALRHFAPTSGYGYDDIGREALGAVFACALGRRTRWFARRYPLVRRRYSRRCQACWSPGT